MAKEINNIVILLKSIFNKIKYFIFKIFLKFSKEIIFKGKFNIKYNINKHSALDVIILNIGILDEYILKNSFLQNEKPVIIDVGANVGYISLPLSKIYPNSKIYSYEADSRVFQRLVKNLELNSDITNVFPYELALQDKNISSINFYQRDLLDGDFKINLGLSTLSDISLGKVKKNSVSASTIDNEVKKLNIKHVDFIKIDVEGNEIKVLEGAIETLNAFNPIIQYEFSRAIDKLQCFNNSIQCFNFLSDLGYLQYELLNENEMLLLDSPSPISDNVNILCIKNK